MVIMGTGGDTVQTISTRELCRLTNVPIGTLNWLRWHGLLLPVVDAGMGRMGDRWSLPNVLALTAYRGLRRRGVSAKHATRILRMLQAMPREELEEHLKANRRCIYYAGDFALPRLLPPYQHDVGIDLDEAQAVEPLLTAQAQALDLGDAWARLNAALSSSPAVEASAGA
jgi:hypothetical protein